MGRRKRPKSAYAAVTDKRTPSYSLAAIKEQFASVDGLRMTGAANTSALALGYADQDVVDVVKTMTPKHFYKSMTTYGDHRVWQDVYHVPDSGLVLYVKFQDTSASDRPGFMVMSFKERERDP